jgi:predicted GIY-YIG superfamily endonuclease
MRLDHGSTKKGKQARKREENRKRVTRSQKKRRANEQSLGQKLREGKHSRSDLFENSGCYLLVKGTKVVYVGESKNVLRRLFDHKEKDWDNYVFIPEPTSEGRKAMEARLIESHKPKYNKALNPNA